MKSRKKSAFLLHRILAILKRLLRNKPEPEDPYAYRTAPVRRPPRDRSGAAVAELDDQDE
jgi:hypothetical protein